MKSLVTVLGIEGDVYYNSCSVCTSKVQLIADGNRGWCGKCRTSTSAPSKRYRLSLKVSHHSVPTIVTIFGYRADGLFGCSANKFFSTVERLKLTVDQIKLAVEKALLSEVIQITRSKQGDVVSAEFVLNTERVIDKLQNLNSTSKLEYSPYLSTQNDRSTAAQDCLLWTKLEKRPYQPVQKHQISTPDCSRDILSRDISNTSFPDISPVVYIDRSGDHITSNSEYESEVKVSGSEVKVTGSKGNVKVKGKRRRCRVQCLIENPPTQNSSHCDQVIDLPQAVLKSEYKSEKSAKVSGDMEVNGDLEVEENMDNCCGDRLDFSPPLFDCSMDHTDCLDDQHFIDGASLKGRNSSKQPHNTSENFCFSVDQLSELMKSVEIPTALSEDRTDIGIKRSLDFTESLEFDSFDIENISTLKDRVDESVRKPVKWKSDSEVLSSQPSPHMNSSFEDLFTDSILENENQRKLSGERVNGSVRFTEEQSSEEDSDLSGDLF